MILKKLYTDPSKFFEPIEFVNGINFIYAYRDPNVPKDIDSESDLNGLGKSSFLDLIDFCLGSQFDGTHSPRLYSALQEEILLGITVYLEFEVEGTPITVFRSFNSPNIIGFKLGQQRIFYKKIEQAREYLFNYIFSRSNYSGIAEPIWLRSLIQFYIKILKYRKAEYPDPFNYLDFKNKTALLQFHLFLLNINNSLFVNLFNLNQQIKKSETFEKENRERVMDIYGFKKFNQAESRLNQMNTELEELKDKLLTFHFARSQQINVDKANDLSKQINDLTLKNYLDQQKIDSYKESIKANYSIRIGEVEKLYNETTELVGTQIRKTLEDTINFKKLLQESRKSFVEKEIETLTANITVRNTDIDNLDQLRAEIYNILSTANTVKNYTDSRNLLDSKLKEATILGEQINSSKHYTLEIAKLTEELDKLTTLILSFRDSIIPQEQEISQLITSIHSSIYPNNLLPHIFSFSTDIKSDWVMKMSILEGSKKHGKGYNKARTLIYDLAVLFYSINKGYNAPRFIIHDGIFDGVDKAKALETIEFLDKKVKEGYKFQYIVTLNDEGILKDYGKRGELLHERILKEAIVLLTPSKSLFGKDF